VAKYFNDLASGPAQVLPAFTGMRTARPSLMTGSLPSAIMRRIMRCDTCQFSATCWTVRSPSPAGGVTVTVAVLAVLPSHAEPIR
jgi:hypothetical protein